ncbi:MAG: hypothetical protein RLZZ293_230 [Pseudomonadota bacterium]|jgi:primosomal replication protein N
MNVVDQSNQVKLSGIISKVYPLMTSPTGAVISRIILTHNSQQLESKVLRKVHCNIFCVAINQNLSQEWLNCQVVVSGFLSMNMQKQIVLHITNLQNLD